MNGPGLGPPDRTARPAGVTPLRDPTRPQSISSHIVRDVIKGLYEGRYVAGQRLVEPDLMEDYQVGRSTVREALKELSSHGIVILAAHRGAHIRKLRRHEAENLFLTTEVVLGLAARQAALHSDAPGARDTLTEALARIQDHRDADGRFEYLRRRNRYIRKLVAISGNDEVQRLLPRLQVHLIRNKLSVPLNQRVTGFEAITSAVLSRDPAKAEDAARAYVRRTANWVLPHFPE
ncbi:GntR family transcriptional regulator [Pseudooceanicola aestuarii]|uniref:GntR family transcriptional regulator n=1 Tax=Pseudooceanicola aestuarii TaxID=2697319 RepID=UPI0019542852|nr:GntR family transcriptional regulator [Pseudooceanicola aestuarii]